jgi:hypothetical protein
VVGPRGDGGHDYVSAVAGVAGDGEGPGVLGCGGCGGAEEECSKTGGAEHGGDDTAGGGRTAERIANYEAGRENVGGEGARPTQATPDYAVLGLRLRSRKPSISK